MKDRTCYYECKIDIRGLLIREFGTSVDEIGGKVDGVYEMVHRERLKFNNKDLKEVEDGQEEGVQFIKAKVFLSKSKTIKMDDLVKGREIKDVQTRGKVKILTNYQAS